MLKPIVFLAHDPGGANVIYEVFKYAKEKKDNVKMFLYGPAKTLHKRYSSTIDSGLLIEKLLFEYGDFTLITGTSWNSDIEIKAIIAAKKYNLNTIAILDYWSNYKSRFYYEGSFIFPDNIFVMDEHAKNEAIEDGIPSNIIRIVGQPYLDKFINKEKKVSRKRTGFLFISQPLHKLYDVSLGYNEYLVMEDLLKIAEITKNQLYIKFHPKDDKNFISMYKKYSIEENKSIFDSFELIIGMSSMMLLELSLLGENVVSYQPNLIGQDLCITNRLKITKGIYCFKDLFDFVNSKQYRNKDSQKIDMIWMDGKSTVRCYETISEIELGDFDRG